MARKTLAFFLVCIVVVAAMMHLSDADPDDHKHDEKYKACFNACFDKCNVKTQGYTNCEMNCDNDCEDEAEKVLKISVLFNNPSHIAL
ncbi:hypothetical protein ACHQM5_014712 [Ranunculus cassubicifolius]